MQEFVICARSRTGSGFLVSLLNNHPVIACRGEELRDIGKRTLSDAIDHALRSWRPLEAVGFKIFYYHPLGCDHGESRRLLFGRKNIKVIHLVRNNILATSFSETKMRLNGVSHVMAGENLVHDGPIYIKKELLLEQYHRTTSLEDREKEAFLHFGLDAIDVTYEDLISESGEIVKSIHEFLGVPAVPAQSPLVKQNPLSLRNSISNFEELLQDEDLAKLPRLIWD